MEKLQKLVSPDVVITRQNLFSRGALTELIRDVTILCRSPLNDASSTGILRMSHLGDSKRFTYGINRSALSTTRTQTSLQKKLNLSAHQQGSKYNILTQIINYTIYMDTD